MPWPTVTYVDIQDRFRTLSSDEMQTIGSLISDAEDILANAAANLGIQETDDEQTGRTFTRIVANMVIRVLRNPDGYLTETIDDYTYRRDAAVSAGSLYVTPAEVEQLRPATAPRRRGAFTIVLGNS